MVAPVGSESAGEHRRALHRETLFGAVVDHRDARQGHDQEQCLLQAGLVADREKAIDIVVVDEARHAERIGVDAQHAADTVREHRGRSPACEYIERAAVEWKIQHAG